MCTKIQLVFPKHNFGQLAKDKRINLPPPLGLLTLSSYINMFIPLLKIEIYDGNRTSEEQLIREIDAPIIGFSVVFSNYSSGLNLAERIKHMKPNTTIIFGGPHVNGFEKQILNNNPFIDYVFSGESEIGFTNYLIGDHVSQIPGLCYRENGNVIKNKTVEIDNLDTIPLISLAHLRTDYQWQDNVANNSAFPISGIRGCFKTNRCDYCSLASLNYRALSVDRYWEQLQFLTKQYGIKRFFETGDTFSSSFAKKLAKEKPKFGSFPRLRIYSYPGLINERNIEHYLNIGVDNVFIGIESVLMWQKNEQIRTRGSSIKPVLKELELLSSHGISIMPSFILGLPTESKDSLKRNMELILEISNIGDVSEILLNTPFPLPNSNFFKWCINSEKICKEYYSLTGIDIRYSDKLNYHLLSRLFIKQFASIGYERILETMIFIKESLPDKVASFGVLEKHQAEVKCLT